MQEQRGPTCQPHTRAAWRKPQAQHRSVRVWHEPGLPARAPGTKIAAQASGNGDTGIASKAEQGAPCQTSVESQEPWAHGTSWAQRSHTCSESSAIHANRASTEAERPFPNHPPWQAVSGPRREGEIFLPGEFGTTREQPLRFPLESLWQRQRERLGPLFAGAGGRRPHGPAAHRGQGKAGARRGRRRRWAKSYRYGHRAEKPGPAAAGRGAGRRRSPRLGLSPRPEEGPGRGPGSGGGAVAHRQRRLPTGPGSAWC